MAASDLTQVHMSDQEIFDLLKEFLDEITGEGDSITEDTLLIDDLGLDSLGFLDLFFTIQTSIQKEVTNDQMRQLIAEEVGFDRSLDFQNLSDGEKDRELYPRLSVRSFVNIIRRQLDGGLKGVDLDQETDRILGSQAVDKVLGTGFEQLKEQRIEEYLNSRQVTDPSLIQAVRDAFEEVTPDKVKELMQDRNVARNVMQGFLKRYMQKPPEEFKDKLFSGMDFGLSEKELSDQFFESMQKEPDRMAEFLLNEPVVQELIVREIIDTRVDDIFESEMQRQSRELDSEEITRFVQSNFFTPEFKQESIRKYVDPNHAHADLIEQVMDENFDDIVQKEMQRILGDTELRNRLVQDYIRDNFDPMEAMELNQPEKMKALQQEITQKYINENMDSIMNRYMEEYIELYGDSMLESMPEEEEIEVEGDAQDEFMQKFVNQMNMDENAALKKPEEQIEAYIELYQIEDPLMLSFMETNFEEMKLYFEFFEDLVFNEERLLQWAANTFELNDALYLYSIFDEFQTSREIRRDFTRQFLNEHFEELMELSIRQQFLSEAEEVFEEEDEERFRNLLEELVKTRLKLRVASESLENRQQGAYAAILKAIDRHSMTALMGVVLQEDQARWFIRLLVDNLEDLQSRSADVQRKVLEGLRPRMKPLMQKDLDHDRREGIADEVLQVIEEQTGFEQNIRVLERLASDPQMFDRFLQENPELSYADPSTSKRFVQTLLE